MAMLASAAYPVTIPLAQAQASSHSAAVVARSAAELLYSEQGVYGVVFMETDGTMLYKHNADLPFVAASLYKLVVMVDFYSRRERGEISFDDLVTLETGDFSVLEDPDRIEDTYFPTTDIGRQVPVGELMEALMTFSSNVAARAFLRITNTINLNHIAHDMGMIDTHILVPLAEISPWPSATLESSNFKQTQEALDFIDMWGAEGLINITTPADIALFFLQLANRELISAEVSEEMETLLFRQQINDRLPFMLPQGTQCAHKTGNLVNVVHDAGIVYGANGPTVVVALSEAVEDDERAAAVIQRLGMIAYGATELPPIPESSPAPD
jgi:beta-lactamase class A